MTKAYTMTARTLIKHGAVSLALFINSQSSSPLFADFLG